MGREIRRVPADWDHPRQPCKHAPWKGGCDDAKAHGGQCLVPLYDRSFREAAQSWKAGFAAWEAGVDENRADNRDMEYWEWDGQPPERESYRPDWPIDSTTHYQVYETVSEGTPVMPHFATKGELIDYLVAHGDLWDQHRGDGGWTRENATAFVEREWAMTLIVATAPDGTERIMEPRDGQKV